MLSVPLSLAGAFVVMWTLGFTLNILSLIALVLCVGFVVDDAIVVIENIVRHMEQGMAPLQAALTGVSEIGFTVVSITLSLIAVFAPMVFGNNIFTMLMREFSVTLIATIVISAVVSLTLTPALCGRSLLHERPGSRVPGRLERLAERFDDGLLGIYERSLDWAMHHRRVMRWQPPILLVLTVGLAVAVGMTAGGGLMPQEDIGLMQAQISASANISPTQLAKRTREVAAIDPGRPGGARRHHHPGRLAATARSATSPAVHRPQAAGRQARRPPRLGAAGGRPAGHALQGLSPIWMSP